MNELLTDNSTNNIIELNELIYVRSKLVYDKIVVPLRNSNRNSKSGWEIRLEIKMTNIQEAEMIKQRKKRWNVLWRKEKSNTLKEKKNLKK